MKHQTCCHVGHIRIVISLVLVFLLAKNNYPDIPPPSYFMESPPDYNSIVCNNRSPHILLADLQPHQRPFSVSWYHSDMHQAYCVGPAAAAVTIKIEGSFK